MAYVVASPMAYQFECPSMMFPIAAQFHESKFVALVHRIPRLHVGPQASQVISPQILGWENSRIHTVNTPGNVIKHWADCIIAK